MKKVLVCSRHGGWGLSRDAFFRLRELGSEHALGEPDIGEPWSDGSLRRDWGLQSFCRDIPRDDPLLLQVFEEMGQDAASHFCEIAEVEIPDDVEWEIEEYDGREWVAEKHRVWQP